MAANLLDVNVLVALSWGSHEDHEKVRTWFMGSSKAGWATCPFTQAGCVRILSNPAFSKNAPSLQQALELLSVNLKHPSHVFWPDDLSFVEAVRPMGQLLVGHKQVTDAYLLGLAIRRKGKLVTLDRSISALLTRDKQASLLTL
jgi:toxin-antitoxin system PIN domain toxin